MVWFKYNINDLTEEQYTKYYNLLSHERKNYVSSLKNQSAKKQTVAAEMLIKTALKDDTALILRDESGKPYIKNRDIYISISHSYNYAVCAIDDKPIGIDIEKIRDINLKTAKKFCSSKELLYINEVNSISRFFEIWTAKEATYKLLNGKIKKFKDIDVLNRKRQYFNFDNYTVCVTALEDNMEKIASFTIDHLKLEPGLYVSRKDVKNGVTVTTFDMRITAPNREPVIDVPALHTIEHLAATYLRNSDIKNDVVYFGPMGCRTGCYILLFGDLKSEDIIDIVLKMCDFIIDFEGEIPGATPEECGNYSEQNLNIAKFYIKKYKKDLIEKSNFVY